MVSTVDDVVNGDTSSPSALLAHPGSDGISLREAILAADNAPAGAHVYVQFADALAGSTIQLTQVAPLLVTHDGLTIAGLMSSGLPTVTVVASPTWPACSILLVEASQVTIRRLAFLGGGPANVGAVLIRGGTGRGGSASDSPCLSARGPSTVSDVEIDVNTFTNLPGGAGRVSITNGDATIDDVRISDNTFTNANGTDDGDAVFAQNWASNSSIESLTIEGNHFEGISFGIELQPGASGDPWIDSPASGDQIVGTRISNNVFDESWNPIWIGTLAFGDLASGNVMDGTVIDANVFNMGSRQNGITLTAGSLNASGNSIDDTQIVDNLLVGDQPGIFLSGGGGGDNASDNHVSGVEIANDTVVSNMTSPALWSGSTFGSGTGNSVTGLDVRNTIFWGPGWPFNGDITTSNVESSIVKQPGFAGTNGNIAGDPLFVDAAGGDYRLAAASPAIDAGTGVSAPAFDLDGGARVGLPDIGAYEFGAAPRPRLSVDTEEQGGSGVVTSTPTGIDCATECSASFDQGAAVSLSATADDGSQFLGWSGGCSGSTTCQVTMATAESVTAVFGAQAAPSLSAFSPTAGTTGTSVTIAGSDLTGATAVTFGGTAAQSFSVDSDTQITAAVAAGTTTGTVAVTTPDGTATSSGIFTFFSAPTITSFSPGSGGVHATVTVTGTNLAGATHVRLDGVSAPFSAVSATKLTFTVPEGASSGSIEITTPGGTVTSGGGFTVSPPPTVTSISPGSGPVGTTVTITGTNLTGTVGVMIGSIVTVPTSVSATSVTFTVPPGAPTGAVRVLTTSGSATSAATFTVTG